MRIKVLGDQIEITAETIALIWELKREKNKSVQKKYKKKKNYELFIEVVVKVSRHCYNIQPGIFFPFYIYMCVRASIGPSRSLLARLLVTAAGSSLFKFHSIVAHRCVITDLYMKEMRERKKKLKTQRNIFRAFFTTAAAWRALKGLTSTTVTLCRDLKKNKMRFNHIATTTTATIHKDLETFIHIYIYIPILY